VSYFTVLAIAVGFGLPLAVIPAALGQARAATTAFESMARQPELAGRLQTAMIIAMAFIESLVIYALLMFFMLYGNLPPTAQMVEVAKAAAHAEAAAPASK
jgi:F-type H+-transporting ATPase subunit c